MSETFTGPQPKNIEPLPISPENMRLVWYTDLKSDPASWPPITQVESFIKQIPFGDVALQINRASWQVLLDKKILAGLPSQLSQDIAKSSDGETLMILFNQNPYLFATPGMLRLFNCDVVGGRSDLSWMPALDGVIANLNKEMQSNQNHDLTLGYLKMKMIQGLIQTGWRYGQRMNDTQQIFENTIQNEIKQLISARNDNGNKNTLSALDLLSKNIHSWAGMQSVVLSHLERHPVDTFVKQGNQNILHTALNASGDTAQQILQFRSDQKDLWKNPDPERAKNLVRRQESLQATSNGLPDVMTNAYLSEARLVGSFGHPPEWKKIFQKTQQDYQMQ